MKIKVKPEGRDDIYIPEKESLKEWILYKKFDHIHNFIPTGFAFLGADHEVKSVLKDIDDANSLAILIGAAFKHNMKHALSIIEKDKMEMYDIGEVTLKDLAIEK